MKEYFIDLFEYNNWANDKIIHKIQSIDHEFVGKTPLDILSHIVSTQDFWLERVKGKTSHNIYLWESFSIQEIEVLSMTSYREWIKFISKMSGNKFAEVCKYKNSKGEEKAKSFQDIFQHIINHSSYHRGQINNILKQNDISPVITDFIYYC